MENFIIQISDSTVSILYINLLFCKGRYQSAFVIYMILCFGLTHKTPDHHQHHQQKEGWSIRLCRHMRTCWQILFCWHIRLCPQIQLCQQIQFCRQIQFCQQIRICLGSCPKMQLLYIQYKNGVLIYIVTALLGSFPSRPDSAGRSGYASRSRSAGDAAQKCSKYIYNINMVSLYI